MVHGLDFVVDLVPKEGMVAGDCWDEVRGVARLRCC